MQQRFRILDALYLTLICAVAISACHLLNNHWLNPFRQNGWSLYTNAVASVITVLTTLVALFDRRLRNGFTRRPGRMTLLSASVIILMVIATRTDQLVSLHYMMYPQPSWAAMALDQLIYEPLLSSTHSAFPYGIVIVWMTLWIRKDCIWAIDWVTSVGMLTGVYWVVSGFAAEVSAR